VTVRIIEATITVTIGGTTRTERYRLVTTLLDHHLAPAGQIADTYAHRWAAETGLKDLKTVLLQGRALRANTPVRAHQENLGRPDRLPNPHPPHRPRRTHPRPRPRPDLLHRRP
jgi:hypothetical protein